MNRYEQYVPVKLDYKPYIPNFENWAKVLTQQQQKYDTFEQAFTLANPEHIKQDSGEYKIWQDYMQNTKDEVKNAFLKDAKYGNQKLKNKMFELQKEMQGGLYKGLETRHNEYQAASQQLSEGLKDQPEYRQWYFMNQFKANPMSYNKGEFNHINPVIVEKNPEVDKKIAEWTKTLVPAERSNEVVSMSPDGKWIINEKNLEAIIPKQVYQTKLREFLANTPEYNKDLQIRVAYNQAHRTPENENLLQAAHLQAVDLQRQQLTLDKDEYLNTKSQDKIKELQQILNSKGFTLAEDGLFGINTLNALRKYTIEINDSGALTKWTQEVLSSKGYNVGIVDGIAGAPTMFGIEQFQRAKGLGTIKRNGYSYLGGDDWYYLIEG